MELFRLLGTIAVENEQANRAIADTASNANAASDETTSSTIPTAKTNEPTAKSIFFLNGDFDAVAAARYPTYEKYLQAMSR